MDQEALGRCDHTIVCGTPKLSYSEKTEVFEFVFISVVEDKGASIIKKMNSIIDDMLIALVFDPGHCSLRFGAAMTDPVKLEIPAVVGIAPEEAATTSFAKRDGRRLCIGVRELREPQPGMEVQSYMKDGQVDNWDLFEKILDYCYYRVIESQPYQHPVVFTETVWTTPEARNKLAELLFEKYNVPALFLVNNAVTSAIACGRNTALVVDAGASHISVVPVLEGNALESAAVQSPIGGDHLAVQAHCLLSNMRIPLYFTEAERNLTLSWQQYILKTYCEDFCKSVAQVSETPFNKRTASAFPDVHYEFPNGHHQVFGAERFRLPENLFAQVPGVTDLVCEAASRCDPAALPELWNSVVSCGGVSVLKGWVERLTRDLMARTPPIYRLKTHVAASIEKRRFAAWFGGSIAAMSCPNWITLKEYEEVGMRVFNANRP